MLSLVGCKSSLPLPPLFFAFIVLHMSVLRLEVLEGDAGCARQRGSGLSSTLSGAAHTSEMLLPVFLFLVTQHVLQQSFSMAASPGAKAAVSSRVSSATSICIPDANSSGVSISHGGISGPPTRPQCHCASQQPHVQALTLLGPPPLPYLTAGQHPLPLVRMEKSPFTQHGTVSFFLGIRKLEHGRDFYPQPDLQALSKVNSFTL